MSTTRRSGEPLTRHSRVGARPTRCRSRRESIRLPAANPLRFTGAYSDPSLGGDYYQRARNYDPDSGRFTTVDPQPAGTGSPTVSRYAYADGNPLVNLDPTGQLSLGGIVDDINGGAKKTGDWVKKHQADVVGVVAGAAVGIGCEVATGGTGSVGCAAAAGAAGNATSYAWKTKVQHKGKFSLGGTRQTGRHRWCHGRRTGSRRQVRRQSPRRRSQQTRRPVRIQSRRIRSPIRARSVTDDEASGLADAAGCHSFAPTTAVLLANGTTKPIKDVKVGDQVTATDPTTGATTARTVTALHDNRDRVLTDVTVSTAGAAANTIHTTAHYRFFDATIGDWVTAGSCLDARSPAVRSWNATLRLRNQDLRELREDVEA
jgi:RHS repeat-associated protein